MVKKMLLTLTAAGMLAVPAGMALAQDDGAVPTAPVTTCQDQDRSRDQLRLHQSDPVTTQDQVRTQDQERAQHQYRIDDGDCTADCTGSQTQSRYGEMGQSDHNGFGR